MKINPLTPSNAISQYKLNTVKKNDSQETVANDDKIELSDDAKFYLAALSAAKDAQDVDMNKVNEIKEKINNGTYNVTSEDVAKKMIIGSKIDFEA